MKTYAVGERVDIPVASDDANFDRACDMARKVALQTFGVDDDGHIQAVAEANRSESSIEIQFLSYRVSVGTDGVSHIYQFAAWVEVEGWK